MNREEFVKQIISKVRESAIYAMETNLHKPAGRKPDEKLLEMSRWYNNLKENDRITLKKILVDSIDEAIFGFFCVLDGVRGIELGGDLELVHKSEQENTIINKGDIELHDLYNDLIRDRAL